MAAGAAWDAPREAFVSSLVLEEAARGAGVPIARHLRGAVLLADVAGSVRAAQQLLAEGGARGAEVLSAKLNAPLRAILGAARAWGGDAIRFLGDAVLILVPAVESEGGEPAACLRAFRIARDALAPYPVPQGVPGEPLKVHCALAAGALVALSLGSGEGPIDVSLHGEPLARMASAIALAPTGALCAAPEARPRRRAPERPAHGPAQVLEAVGCRVPPGALRPGGYAVFEGASEALEAACAGQWVPGAPDIVPRPPRAGLAQSFREILLGDERLPAYLPRDALRILSNRGRFLPELRVVTSLFALLEPAGAPEAASPDHPGGLFVVNRCVRVVQAAAQRAEGVVRAFFRDDKGFVALVTFGTAGAAHADDPLRACAAAVRIREAFAAEALGRVSVGLCTGRAFCGLVGDESRCEYNVLGDAVNRAARLMAAAAGRSGPTAHLRGRRGAFQGAPCPRSSSRRGARPPALRPGPGRR
eukprot:tig00021238_g19539.t1